MQKKIIKLMFLLISCMLAFGVLIGTSLKLTASPKFCIVCHEIKPEYSTWESSSHSQVTCIKCHKRPGFGNLLDKRGALNQFYRHFAKKFYLPIDLPEPIKNEMCLKCHNVKRPVTARGDIKMNHPKHLAQGVKCIDCHNGVAHGKIGERQMTIDAVWARWTEAYGKVQMNPQFTSLQMKDCLNCHSARDAPMTCESCHKEIVKPPSHQNTQWKTTHGINARQNLDGCDRCHSFTKEFLILNVKDPVVEYVRTNRYCYTCHLTRPAGHGLDWKKVHPGPASANKQGCLVCHNYQPPRSGENATKTYCMSCHRKNHRYFNRTVHPIPLPPGTKPQQMCFTCHNYTSCARCHYFDFDSGPRNPVTAGNTRPTN